MRTFSQNVHVLFFAFQVGINQGNANAGTLVRKSAPVERHVEHIATGSVPGGGPSAQDVAERMARRTAKATSFLCPGAMLPVGEGARRANVSPALVVNKTGKKGCVAARLSLEEERQQPLAILKVKMAVRGLDLLPEEAVSDEELCLIANMAQEGYLGERSQMVTREDRQRLQLASLEARCANLSRQDKQVLKGLRALRRKGLI